MVAACPAERFGGGQGGGEVASEAGEVREAAAGGGGEAASAVGHLLHAAAGAGQRWVLSEPEAVADDQPAPIGQARVQGRRQADVSHAAALRRARQERAAREAGTPTLGTPPALRTTA